MRIALDDEKICIALNRYAWSARQLQRVLARSQEEADTTERRARDDRPTAPRSGGAARRRPNDSIGIDRAGSDPTIGSRCLGRGAHRTASEAHQGANGPGHTRRQRNMGVGVEVGANRREVIQFFVCALTPQFSCGRSAQYAHYRR